MIVESLFSILFENVMIFLESSFFKIWLVWPHYLLRSNQWKESFLYKLFMKLVWDCLSCFKMTLASFWNRIKQFQTNLALIMTIHFAHDCVEMVRCSSVFRMSSIFAETSVSRTKKTLRGNWKVMFTHIWLSQPVQLWETASGFFVQQHWALLLPRFRSPYGNAIPCIQFFIL